MDLQGLLVQRRPERLGGAADVFRGRVADGVVVDGFEAEGADEVVGQALMRGESDDQFEGDGLARRLEAGRRGLRDCLGGFPGHDLDLSLCPGGFAGGVPASAPSGAVFLAGHSRPERKARFRGTGATRSSPSRASMGRTHPFAEDGVRPKPRASEGVTPTQRWPVP